MTEKKTQELNCYSSKLFHAIYAICRYVKVFFLLFFISSWNPQHCTAWWQHTDCCGYSRKSAWAFSAIGKYKGYTWLYNQRDCRTYNYVPAGGQSLAFGRGNNGGAVGGGGGTDFKICPQKNVLVPRPQKMFCTFLTRNTFGCEDKWWQSTWYENKFGLYPLTPLPSFPETVQDR